MAPKVKKIKTENVNKFSKIDWTEREKSLLQINKGLKDQISYEDELLRLKQKSDKFNEREIDAAKDVLDKTKDIFTNRKNLHEEQLTSVNLHKLERRLISEGLHDQVAFVQKLKEEDRIQKQINRTINTQAKVYSGIGSSIDGFIRKIPGVGGMVADLLGTGDLGNDMAESFRTSLSGAGGKGGKGFFAGSGEEFAGGFGMSLFARKEGGFESRDAIRSFFSSGLTGALGITAVFAAATKLFSIGMQQGFASQGPFQAIKRMFAGGAFEGIREAFGTGAAADKGTLARLIFNKRRFGISEKDQAKILAAQVNITGLSQKSALNIQSSLASSAAMRGVLPEDVFADIANSTEHFAMYAKDGGQNIGEAAIRARELGVSLDTVFKISDGILDFQSSIENELKASLLIGRQLNLNEARRLAMAGDMAGLQDEILRQVGSEAELQKMNMIQRKSLAGALGITVTELNKLASGELEIKNSDMKQNTSALTTLTFAVGALAVAMGLSLLGRGMGYTGQLFTKGGFKPNLKGYTGRIAASTGLPDMRTTLGRQWVKSGATVGMTSRIAQSGTALATGARAFGPWGIALSLLIGMGISMKRTADNTEDTAENTKKQRDMHTGQFVTSPIIQGIQKTGVTTN